MLQAHYPLRPAARDLARPSFSIRITRAVKVFNNSGEIEILQPGETIDAVDVDAERQLWRTVEFGSVRFAEAELVEEA